MKNHPIIKAVYVLLGLVLICLVAVQISSTYTKINTLGSIDNMQLIIDVLALIFTAAIFTIGLLQAKVKGVGQYSFYLASIFLLPIPSLWYHTSHCHEKFCGIFDFFISVAFVSLSLGIIAVYYLGKFLVKRGYLSKFIKFLYILTFGLFVIVASFYMATEFFRFDYTIFDDTFRSWFNLSDWLSSYIDSFMTIATVAIPALIFAIYPLKIAEAEYKDKGGVVNKNN